MTHKYSTQAKTAGHKLQKATRKHGAVVHVCQKPQPHKGHQNESKRVGE